MTDWKRDENLDELVRAIEEDPSIQLDLLTRTSNGAHELDPEGMELSQVPFPFWEMSQSRILAMSASMLVLNKAKSYLGTGEDSKGRSRPGIWYGNRVHNSGFDTAPWCDMFAGQCMFETFGEEILKAVGCFALTTAHAAFLHARGATNRPTVLSPGALAFQNWELDGIGNGNLHKINHVEFVERDNRDGTATFVGGNVDNGVRRRTRSKAYLVVQSEWWKLFDPTTVLRALEDWYAVPGGRTR